LEAAELAVQQGNKRKARRLLAKVLNLDPHHAEAQAMASSFSVEDELNFFGHSETEARRTSEISTFTGEPGQVNCSLTPFSLFEKLQQLTGIERDLLYLKTRTTQLGYYDLAIDTYEFTPEGQVMFEILDELSRCSPNGRCEVETKVARVLALGLRTQLLPLLETLSNIWQSRTNSTEIDRVAQGPQLMNDLDHRRVTGWINVLHCWHQLDPGNPSPKLSLRLLESHPDPQIRMHAATPLEFEA